MSKKFNSEIQDFFKAPTTYHKHFKFLSLSNKIVLLITFVILIAVIPASIFTTSRVAQVIYDRVSINAVSINTVLCHSLEIQRGLMQQNWQVDPLVDKFMFDYVNDIDNSDEASVAIFDKNLNLRVLYNPGKLIKFSEEAKEIVKKYAEYDNITWHENYLMPNKAFGYVRDLDGHVIGFVVTGYSDSIFNNSTKESILFLIMLSFFSLIIGFGGAIGLASHIKRILYGLEPAEIAAMLQERNVLLNSVREGVITINSDSIITLVNTEAEELLKKAGIPNSNQLAGKSAKELFSKIPVTDVMTKRKILCDISVKIGGTLFIITAVPLILQNNLLGVVITFREKSEVEELANQLTGFKNYATALRAQTHEFMNKMHVIMGLIDMKAYDELKNYTQEIAYNRQSEVSYITSRLQDITLAGFILAKISRSRELDIDFSLSEESELHENLEVPSVHDLVLIIGNIIENAFDILKNYDGERIVSLSILDFDKEIVIVVEDSGPGMDLNTIEKLFIRGYTSKGEGHGFGLHLVKQSVDNLGGSINVESTVGEGTTFTVRLPINKED